MGELNLKTAKEILDEFFKNIFDIPEIDRELAEEIKQLYENSKLSKTNLSNKLDEIIEKRMKERKYED